MANLVKNSGNSEVKKKKLHKALSFSPNKRLGMTLELYVGDKFAGDDQVDFDLYTPQVFNSINCYD